MKFGIREKVIYRVSGMRFWRGKKELLHRNIDFAN